MERKELETALSEIADAADRAALEALRVRYLGRRSALKTALRGLGALPPERQRAEGERLNRAKTSLEEAIQARGAVLRQVELGADLERDRIDVSLPGRRMRIGRHHPVSATVREMVRVFASLGFEPVEGPEVEWDYYNFQALNIPPGHPARDNFSTLWVANPLGDDPDRPMLLRTHTSPMQARVMERRRPPVRVVVPGRVYRYEATGPKNESQFFQVEGLAVDEQITMADLKGVLYAFAREMFGHERRVRFRVDYFPFVEPGADMAIDCFICGGTGCRTCRDSGWIEILGAGMVHPSVLRGVGYDPERYQGFAFGCGVERVAMLRAGVPDIRAFAQNDLRFLRQFPLVS